jgi:hypothetical protein
MKYAIVSSLGGEMILASEADYGTYKSFLKCPECKEPVFLRKAYLRDGSEVAASFVHYKELFAFSCEMRASRYSDDRVNAIASAAREQRLKKLQVSSWKFIKTNLAVDFSQWHRAFKDLKSFDVGVSLLNYAVAVSEANYSYFLNSFLRLESLLRDGDERVVVRLSKRHLMDSLLKTDWRLQNKIASEVMELILVSPCFLETRLRLLSVLVHPTSLQSIDGLLDLEMESEEWKVKFISYLSLQVPLKFLLITLS